MAQPGDGSGAWVPFVRWLQQHTTSPPSAHPAGSDAPSSSDQPSPSPATAAGVAASPQTQHQLQPAGQPTLARPPFASTRRPGARGGVQAAIADCRTENRLLEGYSARQELSVVLAVPGLGLPVNKAPTLTAKQAMSLLKAISEPLISLEAGRLTRKLSSPTKLQPTEEHGVLSLWLLPNDDLALCWQTSVQAPTAAGAAGEGQQASCSVAVWEALAHFPESCFYESDEPVAVIHTLRNDASGRSFYIRPRADIAAHATERAAQQLAQANGSAPPAAAPLGEGPGQPRFYFWLRSQDMGAAMHSLGRLKSLLRRPPTLARRAGVPPSKLEEISSWLMKMEAAAAKQATAQQQPSQEPSIAVSAGGSILDAVSSDSISGGQETQPSRSLAPEASSSDPGCSGEAPLSSQPPLPQQPTFPASPASASSLLPGMLLGRSGPNPAITSALTSVRMAAALSSVVSSSQACPLAHLPAASAAPASAAAAQPSRPASAAAAEQLAEGPCIRNSIGGSSVTAGAGEPGMPQAAAQPSRPIATSTVSASASALYHDRRFNLSAPVAVTVVAASLVQGGTAAVAAQQGGSAWDAQAAAMAGLQAEAVQLATTVAQQQAQGVLESTGRRLMEEQLAEAVISTIRSSRSSHRQRAQSQRAREQAAQEERRFRTALAMPAIRAAAARASGRGLPQAAQHSSPRHPSAGGPNAIPAAPCATAAAAAELGVLPEEITGQGQAAGEPVPGATAPAGQPAEQPATGQLASAAEKCSPPASRLRRRLVAAAPEGRGASGSRVTLSSLQELLRAADEAPAGGSDSSECSAAPAPADQLQQELRQEQQACSEAGSVQGDGEKGASSAAEDGSSTPRRVSLGSLFKLLNGCLDR